MLQRSLRKLSTRVRAAQGLPTTASLIEDGDVWIRSDVGPSQIVLRHVAEILSKLSTGGQAAESCQAQQHC